MKNTEGGAWVVLMLRPAVFLFFPEADAEVLLSVSTCGPVVPLEG